MSEKTTVITVAGEEFDVVKRGYDQAEQVISLMRWLSKYGTPALEGARGEDGELEAENAEDVLGILGKVFEVLDPGALIDLYVLILGCSRDFAMEYFDIAVLIDAVITVYEEQPSFRKVFDRFFSTPALEEQVEDSSTQ